MSGQLDVSFLAEDIEANRLQEVSQPSVQADESQPASNPCRSPYDVDRDQDAGEQPHRPITVGGLFVHEWLFRNGLGWVAVTANEFSKIIAFAIDALKRDIAWRDASAANKTKVIRTTRAKIGLGVDSGPANRADVEFSSALRLIGLFLVAWTRGFTHGVALSGSSSHRRTNKGEG
jgi:hypothetical protein